MEHAGGDGAGAGGEEAAEERAEAGRGRWRPEKGRHPRRRSGGGSPAAFACSCGWGEEGGKV